MRRLTERLLLGLGVVLWYLGLSRLVRRWRRRSPRVLLYHAIASSESDFLAGLDSNTPPDHFERHLDYLARYHAIVPLAVLESGDWPDYAAAITFDDGYRTVFSEAFPRLRQRGMPAALYLVTSVVDNAALVWVNELSWLCRRSLAARSAAAMSLGLPSDALPPAIVHAARESYSPPRTAQVLETVREAAGRPDVLRAARDERLYVTWDEARALAAGSVAIGNHTATHPPLGRLTAQEQEAELTQGHAAVTREVGSCTSVAYPFGSHNDMSEGVAARTGHRSIMHVGLRRYPQPMAIGRIPVRAASDAALFAELEIIAPVKAWWRERAPCRGGASPRPYLAPRQ